LRRTAAMAMAIALLFVAGTAATATTARVKEPNPAHGQKQTSKLKPLVRKRVAMLRAEVRLHRSETWKYQRIYGAKPWRTSRAESRTVGIPYLKHIRSLWTDRKIAAKRKAEKYRQYGYRGANPNVKLGQRMARPYGWHVGSEWDSLYTLWNNESGWDHRAYNPSGACGIPQDMGDCHGFDPGSQISWGLRYIKGRYGSPQTAYSYWRSHNWY